MIIDGNEYEKLGKSSYYDQTNDINSEETIAESPSFNLNNDVIHDETSHDDKKIDVNTDKLSLDQESIKRVDIYLNGYLMGCIVNGDIDSLTKLKRELKFEKYILPYILNGIQMVNIINVRIIIIEI